MPPRTGKRADLKSEIFCLLIVLDLTPDMGLSASLEDLRLAEDEITNPSPQYNAFLTGTPPRISPALANFQMRAASNPWQKHDTVSRKFCPSGSKPTQKAASTMPRPPGMTGRKEQVITKRPPRSELTLLRVHDDVRSIILEFLLTSPTIIRPEGTRWSGSSTYTDLVSVSLVCRKLYEEARPIFYKVNVFYFTLSEQATKGNAYKYYRRFYSY